MFMGNLSPDMPVKSHVEDAIRSLVDSILPELQRAARAEVDTALSTTQQEMRDLHRHSISLMDRVIEAESAAQQLALLVVTSPKGDKTKLVEQWSQHSEVRDPSEGMLGRAVESALMLYASDASTRSAWLRKRGWIQKAATGDVWSDGTPGAGSLPKAEAIKEQVKRDLKPFEYLIKRIKP